MSRVLAARAFIAKMCRGNAQAGMVEYASLAGIVLPRDVDARLLVEPPHGQTELLRDIPRFFQDDAVRHEQGVDIAGRPSSVIGESHRRPADDKYVGDHPSAH
jgi:hypothetical protein